MGHGEFLVAHGTAISWVLVEYWTVAMMLVGSGFLFHLGPIIIIYGLWEGDIYTSQAARHGQGHF